MQEAIIASVESATGCERSVTNDVHGKRLSFSPISRRLTRTHRLVLPSPGLGSLFNPGDPDGLPIRRAGQRSEPLVPLLR